MIDHDLDAQVAEAMGAMNIDVNQFTGTVQRDFMKTGLLIRDDLPEYSSDLPAALTFARHVLKQPVCTGFVLEHDSGGWFVRFYGGTQDFTQMIGPDGSDERMARAICLCGLELLEAGKE